MGDLDGDGLSGTQDPVEERPRTAYTEKGWKTGSVTGTGGWMATTTRGRASGAQGELVNFGEATETATNVGQGERITPRRLWVLSLMGTCTTGWL
jgi:hypothetical protein